MQLQTKGRIAIAAMLDIATYGSRGPVCLADTAEREGVSLSYLEQIFRKLRQRGFVAGIRGPGGGYRLGRPLAAMTVADIVSAVDEDAPACEPDSREERGEEATTRTTDALWSRIDDHLFNYMNSISLELALASATKGVAAAQPPRVAAMQPCARGYLLDPARRPAAAIA